MCNSCLHSRWEQRSFNTKIELFIQQSLSISWLLTIFLSLIGCEWGLHCILVDQACLHEWPWLVPIIWAFPTTNEGEMNVCVVEVFAPGIKNGWLRCNQSAYLSFCQSDMIEDTKEIRGRDQVLFCGLARTVPSLRRISPSDEYILPKGLFENPFMETQR